jgi:hypothetical protein
MRLLDLNADGKLDLVVDQPVQAKVSVSLGRGDGTFAGAVAYPVANNLAVVVPGDVNGDGRMDLLMSFGGADSAGALAVRFGKRDGAILAQGTVSPSGKSCTG